MIRGLALVLGWVFLSACSRAPATTNQRVAFLPFENLTGDASLNWATNAAPSIALEDLTGVSGITALRALTRSDAYLERADRLVHGYFTGTAANPALHIEVEDAARHTIAETFAESGANALAEMNNAVKKVDSTAHSFSSSNPDAVAAWGSGDFEKAVTLDPDFGLAWLAWAEKLQLTGGQAQAVDVASRALDRTTLQSSADRLRLELFLANARHDFDARERATTALVRLTPNDPALLLVSAQVEMEARNFREASSRYRAMLQIEPSNTEVLNSLGYAEGLGGDLDAARKTFEQYGQRQNAKPNSLDSLGEVYFTLGRFAEAEKSFLAAHQANPALTAGGDLLKAAYSRLLAGDKKGADALAEQYFQFRVSQHDPLAAWREACWLYATGRRDQALQKLGQISNPELAKKQSMLWTGQLQLSNNLAALKQSYQATLPTADGQIRVLYASALVAAGKKEEARSLLETWPMPWSPGDPLLESIALPKTIELRTALGMPAR